LSKRTDLQISLSNPLDVIIKNLNIRLWEEFLQKKSTPTATDGHLAIILGDTGLLSLMLAIGHVKKLPLLAAIAALFARYDVLLLLYSRNLVFTDEVYKLLRE